MTGRSRHLAAALTTLAIAGSAAAVWGIAIERKLFTVRHVSLPVLPSDADWIRVLHISDLHMAPWQSQKQEWMRSLRALHPDLVINTGDNLGHRDGMVGIRRALEPFAGIPGAFVHGSNDYIGPRLKNPLRYFRGPSTSQLDNETDLDTATVTGFFTDELGWSDLNNRAQALTVRGTRVELFGVDDPHIEFDRIDLVAGAVDELRAVEDTAAEVSVGVSHAPYRRILDDFVARGADVIFAGHTHGGQVRLPGFGALVTNCDIPRSKVAGTSTWNNGVRSASLNVSAGVGTSIYAPVRFACRPEVSLVTLVPTN
ncbi:metallophosphoesterase [Rathayibacter toxicus]|uniref:Metallophosphatase n=1 Tax=Rathayibacter toxicus TaxID=145458 RepID=A0A0C5BFI5_9MICO|nr:metallophosphoesterase [Rathayibacter toxicus]AJM78091.1 metallophosphatase [Rathayibacter toxicus]ALS57660.1 metallophosphatase [Rathayibacter toxicus]KKM45006.1 metallophosphatase [Rathayibacter toxicus]PPG20668.1 metallophosphoesterase [Rathayibacter toxicus]PPG45772.1 metallophosphoesterase [Rathayibacter toxicus]